MPKILLVEDDVEINDSVRIWLQSERYVVDACFDGNEAIYLVDHSQYDLIILDIQLPGKSGIEICKHHRAKGGKTPILMLTGLRTIDEKVEGLDAGAHDYLTKPFSPEELSARIRSLLRRVYTSNNDLTVGELRIDLSSRQAWYQGRELELVRKEFDVLELFMQNPNKVFSTEALLLRVWNSDPESMQGTRTVSTVIARLRKKMGTDEHTSPIKNIHGLGYKLQAK